MLVRKKTVASIAVARLRKFAEPVAPNTLPEAPPPNAAPMSAPLPCCSSTSPMMPSAAITCTTSNKVSISLSLKRLCVCQAAPGGLADRYEFLGHQRRSADQSAVDVWHCEQLARIRRLYAAAVQNH